MKQIAVSVVTLVLAAGVSACALTGGLRTRGLDLSSPEATVVSFTKAAATGHVDRAQACFLPGGTDYNDIREVLTAEPSSLRYPGRIMLEAIDPDVRMPIVGKRETRDWVQISWRVTFKKAFEIEGQTIRPGMIYDLDATLERRGGKWLIENF